MILRRYPLFLSILLLIQGACSESGSENSFRLTGKITDELTGSPIAGMNIYSCPRTAFGNGFVSVVSKIHKGTTDDCGRYSITIPEDERHYSVHGSPGQSAVIIFSDDAYGEFIFTPAEPGSFSQSFRRPFLDSVRWSFDDSGNLLSVDVRRNTVFSVQYYEGEPYQDIISPTGDVMIGHTIESNATDFKTFHDVPADTWISHKIEVEPGTAETITVNATGNGRSAGEVRFVISGSDRSQQYTYVLPNNSPLCN
jgi:hypothetical protein